MTIRQLSIFIENQSGTLQKVLELIKQLRIQIIACTIADTAEYGIFRIICSEPDRACSELKAGDVGYVSASIKAFLYLISILHPVLHGDNSAFVYPVWKVSLFLDRR